jgi:hypothetical protein
MKLGSPKHPASRSRKNVRCRLLSTGWDKAARRSLEHALRAGAGRGLPVVFDFDNTIISGDIGEAVLALLAKSGRLDPKSVCDTLSPDLHLTRNSKLRLRACGSIMEYYEAMLSPTIHGKADSSPLANGYVWATQAMEKLRLSDVISATRQAVQLGAAHGPEATDIVVGGLKYPAPRFREEMVELIALLLRLGYRPWIVSASNVWSVRWMVIHALNPLLSQLGAPMGLPPEQVIGLATLLSDSSGRLYKDAVLVRQNTGYASLKKGCLDSFLVTRHIQFPAPVYSGKVACILDAIGCNPYLSAGDSPSDHPMMVISKYRLWIARADKPETQRLTSALIRSNGKAGWIVQPVPSRVSQG